MLALENFKIYTVSNGVLNNADIILENGKIKAIGKALDLSKCSKIIKGEGRSITPGLIDCHSHLGLNESGVGISGRDTNETSKPLTPEVSVRDGINMEDKAFDEYRKSGITCVGILPGSSNIIGGTGLALKCKGKIVDEAIVKDPIGMKAALGENPKVYYGNIGNEPSTRMGSAAILRQALLNTQEYNQAIKEGNELGDNIDHIIESLLPVVRKELKLMIHCHRHDDIATAIRICKEFDLDYTLEHVTDGFLIDELIKKEGIHCALGPSIFYPSKLENRERDFRTPVEFYKKGIDFSFMSDHPVTSGRNLILSSIIASQWGVSEDVALKAISLEGAKHLGIDDKVGSIEEGKDGDLVIWSRDPLEIQSMVDMTIIDGEIVFDRKGY